MPPPSRYFRKTAAADPDLSAGTNGRKNLVTRRSAVCRIFMQSIIFRILTEDAD